MISDRRTDIVNYRVALTRLKSYWGKFEFPLQRYLICPGPFTNSYTLDKKRRRACCFSIHSVNNLHLFSVHVQIYLNLTRRAFHLYWVQFFSLNYFDCPKSWLLQKPRFYSIPFNSIRSDIWLNLIKLNQIRCDLKRITCVRIVIRRKTVGRDVDWR